MSERVVLRFQVQTPRRRDPMLTYMVVEGGVDAAFSARGQLGSWSLDFEDRVAELHEEIAQQVDPAEYEHKTDICTATFPEGKEEPDAEPDLEWHVDVGEQHG